MNRKLFKYASFEEINPKLMEQIHRCMDEAGMPAEYYLALDFPTDLPYDIYRPGKVDEKLPILLLDMHEELTEISRQSEIVRSISGIHRGEHKLYFPEELLSIPSLPNDILKLLAQRS
jgi:HD superfamily phosphohydrolase